MLLKNQYSIKEKIQLVYYLLRTKLISPKARLIRFPCTIRGGGYIDYGKKLTTGLYCRLEAFKIDKSNHKRINFGNNIQINDYVHISAIENVYIGDNTLIASHVYISDNSHGFYSGGINDSSPLIPPKDRDYMVSPVKIGSNVWIGEGVIVMPGVEIGDGCIIGAHSIVNKNIPPASIAVGSPASVIKQYNFSTRKWEKIS